MTGTDPRPLHQRIAADLRDEILNGALPAGTALPSTQQLRDRFGAANATIQKAVQLLKDEGLLIGRPGASITVRPRRQRTIRPADFLKPAPPGEPYPWLTTVADPGETAAGRLLDVCEAVPPTESAQALGLQPGEPALLRSQLLQINDEPTELVTSYYPLDLARGTAMMEHRKIKGGVPVLLDALGHPPLHAVDLVSARIPTQAEYQALGLPGDLPVLRTFRVVFSHNDRPIEATTLVKAGHLYELRYDHRP
ncbi:hypothetical protein GCM10022221_55100 [Actinocorallia aurea]